MHLWLAGGGTGSNFCPNMQTAESAVVLGYFTPPFLALVADYNQTRLQFVGCVLSFFSINTGDGIHDLYCSQSTRGKQGLLHPLFTHLVD